MKRCLVCTSRYEAEVWRCPECGAEPECRAGWPSFAPALAAANDGYDPDRFEEILAFDAPHFLRDARNALFTWALGRYFPGAVRYLEIGAGIGVVLAAMRAAHPGLEVWGTEIYDSGVEQIAANVEGVRLFQADARALPFHQEFDVVGAFDTLEHIDDDAAVLTELHRSLRPGGGLLVSVPQHPWLWSARDEAVAHKRRYTRRDLLGKLDSAGFEALRVTSFVTLPFPAMWWAAVRNRELREDYDPFAEFKIGAVPRAALAAALGCERWLIRSGVSFPFGGTLFVAARRRPGAGPLG